MNAALSQLELTLWQMHTVTHKRALWIAVHCTKTFHRNMNKNTVRAMGHNQHFHLSLPSLSFSFLFFFYISFTQSVHSSFPHCPLLLICLCEWVWLCEGKGRVYLFTALLEHIDKNCVSVSFLSPFVFHPSVLSILSTYCWVLSVCAAFMFSTSRSLSRFPLCVSLFIIMSVSAVPYCWESKVIFFLLCSSPFLPLSLALWLPLIHYLSQTTLCAAV